MTNVEVADPPDDAVAAWIAEQRGKIAAAQETEDFYTSLKLRLELQFYDAVLTLLNEGVALAGLPYRGVLDWVTDHAAFHRAALEHDTARGAPITHRRRLAANQLMLCAAAMRALKEAAASGGGSPQSWLKLVEVAGSLAWHSAQLEGAKHGVYEKAARDEIRREQDKQRVEASLTTRMEWEEEALQRCVQARAAKPWLTDSQLIDLLEGCRKDIPRLPGRDRLAKYPAKWKKDHRLAPRRRTGRG